MIVVSQPILNASTNKVELIAPMGFGTARGVRLSNFTTDSLVLTNISGVDQSQEYLAPQTQMIYPTANIGATPTVVGTSESPNLIVEYLQVEWSTDPDVDFIGTYPAALPVPIYTQPTTGRSLYQSTGAVAEPFVLQTNNYDSISLNLTSESGLYLEDLYGMWTDEKGNALKYISIITGKASTQLAHNVHSTAQVTLRVDGYYLELFTSSAASIEWVGLTAAGLVGIVPSLPITVSGSTSTKTTTISNLSPLDFGTIDCLSGITLTATGLVNAPIAGLNPTQNPDSSYTGQTFGSGMYVLQAVFPTDAEFIVYYTASSYNGGKLSTLDKTYLLFSSKDLDVVTIGTSCYINKEIYVPSWWALQLDSSATQLSGISATITTATVGTNKLYFRLTPVNGGGIGTQ